MPTSTQYLIERLKPLTNHIFGVPGDYVLNLYHQLNEAFDVCNTTDEQCAGFAADAYARINGFGVVCATYCVGGFKLLNPIAGAYAEKSPVLFISGAPGVKERQNGLLLHHCAGAYECQHNVFKNVTCASAVLDDVHRVSHEIDRVVATMLACKQPGYLEIPRDMVDRNIKYDAYTQGNATIKTSDAENLAEALENTIDWIAASKTPVILAGVEVQRFGFGELLIQFAEKHNIPVATTILGKSVVNEHHPLALGVYAGSISSDAIRSVVEKSDCVIQLGVMQTDMNMGFQPFQCHQSHVITANTGVVRIRRSTYENVLFNDFAGQLLKSKPKVQRQTAILPKSKIEPFIPAENTPVTAGRLFDKINSILSPDLAIIADIGDSLFGASELRMHSNNHFLSPAFYTSMGSSVPSALGVQLANPKARPIVIVGDGAFQMTGMEFSTIVNRNLNPLIFVLNNKGYSTERLLGFDGTYNNVRNWDFHLIPDIIKGGKGYLVQTERELHEVVDLALNDKKMASIIHVDVATMNVTPALQRMTKKLSQSV